MSDPSIKPVFNVKESARDAAVFPGDHFDPDDVDDPDGFVDLTGTVGGPMEDSVTVYHPTHWEVVDGGSFPTDRPEEYWYRTDTDGYVALRARTPDARAWLSTVQKHNTIGKNRATKPRAGGN